MLQRTHHDSRMKPLQAACQCGMQSGVGHDVGPVRGLRARGIDISKRVLFMVMRGTESQLIHGP